MPVFKPGLVRDVACPACGAAPDFACRYPKGEAFRLRHVRAGEPSYALPAHRSHHARFLALHTAQTDVRDAALGRKR